MNHLVETEIPPLYRSWSISQMVGADNITEICEKILHYMANADVEDKGHSLYLYSIENGTGKTSIAYSILKEFHQPRKKAGEFGEFVDTTPIVAVKFANYLKFCNDPYSQDSKNAKKQIELAPFLLLDDVSPWALSSNLHKDKTELVLLMMYRREHLLPTIVTSNLVPTEFDKTFGATVASKVLENFSFIEVRGGDVRPVIYPDMFEKEIS